jgi:hypothetical protein
MILNATQSRPKNAAIAALLKIPALLLGDDERNFKLESRRNRKWRLTKHRGIN